MSTKRHVEGTCTPRKQVFCGQCHDGCFFIRSLDDVACRVDPTLNDVVCQIYDVSFPGADVDWEVSDVSLPGADVGSALRGDVCFRQRRPRHKNVTWDIFIDGCDCFCVFLGLGIVFLDSLCDIMMFYVTSCSPQRFPGMFFGHANGTSCCHMLIYDPRYLGHPRG